MNKGSRPGNLRRLSLGLLAAGLALSGTGVLEQRLRMERDAAEYDQWRVALKHTPAAVTAEATPAPDMSDLPLDGGYAYLRVEVLSRDKDAKTLEVKVLDFGDADGVNVGALPVGAQGSADCSDLLSMAMMIDSGEWIITYADRGQQAFPLRLTSIENPEHFAERAGK